MLPLLMTISSFNSKLIHLNLKKVISYIVMVSISFGYKQKYFMINFNNIETAITITILLF